MRHNRVRQCRLRCFAAATPELSPTDHRRCFVRVGLGRIAAWDSATGRILLDDDDLGFRAPQLLGYSAPIVMNYSDELSLFLTLLSEYCHLPPGTSEYAVCWNFSACILRCHTRFASEPYQSCTRDNQCPSPLNSTPKYENTDHIHRHTRACTHTRNLPHLTLGPGSGRTPTHAHTRTHTEDRQGSCAESGGSAGPLRHALTHRCHLK